MSVKDNGSRAAFMSAVYNGDIETTKLFLSKNVDKQDLIKAIESIASRTEISYFSSSCPSPREYDEADAWMTRVAEINKMLTAALKAYPAAKKNIPPQSPKP